MKNPIHAHPSTSQAQQAASGPDGGMTTQQLPQHALQLCESGDMVAIRFGEAAIELYADGRIVLRGTDILTRSTGPVRIKGASVDIN